MDLNPSGKVSDFPSTASEKGTILVISGKRTIGKTTYCRKMIEKSCQAGLKVAGLLTPGRFEENKRTGIFAIDLASNESRLMASLVPDEIDGFRFGPWTFDSKVFEWGNRCLLESEGADVFVIDELGYLEFDLKIGWAASFEALRKKEFRQALVVIRPECIDAFAKMGFTFQVKEIQ